MTLELAETNGANGHHEKNNGKLDVPVSAATRLRQMINDPNGFVFAPGVYDGSSARTALDLDFDCLYMYATAYLPLNAHDAPATIVLF
jgi:hypothetical protein